MKAANAPGLMAARARHVVEPALKASERADVLQRDPAFGCLFQRRDNVTLQEYSVSAGSSALHKAEGRLQVRRRKSCRGRRNRAGGKEFIRYQNHAAVQLAEI